MTGQDLLNGMEALNQELQLQTSEADVVRALIALNMAQDYYESLASQEGAIKSDQTAEISTTANTETTAFPTGFLRVDRIQLLDGTGGKPIADVTNINEVGGHAWSLKWPLNLTASNSADSPDSYYTNGRTIYWSPTPDKVYYLRCYGFKSASDITASGTFAYDDELRLPFASFAVRILRIGVGDDVADVGALASQTFSSAISSQTGFNRDGAVGFTYKYGHTT